ncbi:MAG TPA: hypothetical protein VGO57_08595 [Verrucomicrobiae bacterium]|jgi:hypothetical protein
MGLTKIISGISVFVTGLLPASCQHHAAPATPPSTAASTNSTVTNASPDDLGFITLTNHMEHRALLGDGKDCILLPKLVDTKNSSIVVTFETKAAGGKIRDMSVAQVDAKNGEPVEVTVGDFHVTFTPNVVDDQ